ncbi:LacI family transcriptional regulator [Bacillus sp. AFS076308]|uniref:LacI family DNA-binding transcriptional regulator n=1 Tax=unclassified Bacillus (in: firmicutes) TaxID=185979 RepID=UPI000BF63F2A|nr:MULTISPECIES: LacI family DNA-binding transcriptional regulator [unclassified Bacillus (in: firmicutes)]PFO01374.1 LacI family transcriptional regulator [Bacillus sp. AFS076308]PGV52217.1 LacI family transcriptional regulator [Bacillus sp. AFS037270]
MTVTIKEVAKLANVAPSTVSRVIANNPRISEATKRKVKKVMEELGYHPNLNARSLSSKATQTIGLVMPSSGDVVFQNPFFPTVLQGISEGVHEKKYALQMTTGRSQQEILEAVIQMVQGKRVDGMILLNSKVEDKVIQYLREIDFPFVVIGKPAKYIEEITHVDNDNVRAMKEATEYLIDQGHSQIAFIGGSPELIVTVDRLNGYKQALENSNIPIKEEYIKHEEFLREGGQEAVNELMALQQRPTALLVVDDFMALGVLNKLDESGIKVPEDISVVSFNNILLSEMSKPPLTSVDINILKLGLEASRGLIEKIENSSEPTKRIIISHQLVERSSCSRLHKEK